MSVTKLQISLVISSIVLPYDCDMFKETIDILKLETAQIKEKALIWLFWKEEANETKDNISQSRTVVISLDSKEIGETLQKFKNNFDSFKTLKSEQDKIIKLSNYILYLISALLEKANLESENIEYILFDKGPGAFTSVRLIASIVQGLGFAKPRKIYGFSALDFMLFIAKHAFSLHPEKTNNYEIISLLDAKMSEFYYGFYINTDNQQEYWQGLTSYNNLNNILQKIKNKKPNFNQLVLIIDKRFNADAIKTNVTQILQDFLQSCNTQGIEVKLCFLTDLNSRKLDNAVIAFIENRRQLCETLDFQQSKIHNKLQKIFTLNYIRNQITK